MWTGQVPLRGIAANDAVLLDERHTEGERRAALVGVQDTAKQGAIILHRESARDDRVGLSAARSLGALTIDHVRRLASIASSGATDKASAARADLATIITLAMAAQAVGK